MICLNVQDKITSLYKNKSITNSTRQEIENLITDIKNLSLEHYGVIETQMIKNEVFALNEFIIRQFGKC